MVGGEITFYPTPSYTATRTLHYAALYELTGESGSEQYTTLTQNGGRIALLYAQYLALTQQASSVAGDGWRYQIGDEMVDKSNQGKGLIGQADGLLQQYRRAVQQQNGYGSRSRIEPWQLETPLKPQNARSVSNWYKYTGEGGKTLRIARNEL